MNDYDDIKRKEHLKRILETRKRVAEEVSKWEE